MDTSQQSDTDLVGSSAHIRELRGLIQRFAGYDEPVLITGETGVGKNLIATRLHRQSGRARGPFVHVNCGAIPDTLFESELFGHVKGAFTHAVANRTGKIELAHGGTLFLDEIGTLSPMAQAKLLLLLDDGCFTRVGDTRVLKPNVRIVAATNLELDEAVEHKQFRSDLLHRLSVLTIHMRPLRERREDVDTLISHFLHTFAEQYRKPIHGLSGAAMNALRSYHWPGNVRELEQMLKRAVILCDDEEIQERHLTDFRGQLCRADGSEHWTPSFRRIACAFASDRIDRLTKIYEHIVVAGGRTRLKALRASHEKYGATRKTLDRDINDLLDGGLIRVHGRGSQAMCEVL